ncbi:MAG: bifunctional diaminohydroxyphosphoribosylaminopyrimidine deaminase/5-amino-6-(5-phosphoribosylamino)uracil reductase RibD [Gemmataceae bacterium]
MELALDLARRGQGRVEPNPMVGAVLMGADGTLVGQGWHDRFGGPHAEIVALNEAGERARGATLFVTLEPCCHQGKTPPCTDAILRAGVSRVILAMLDPFPQVAGQGMRQLQEAGIPCEVRLRQAEARALNAPYIKLIQEQLPWVIAKWAMTLDGKIASRERDSRWVSCGESRQRVQQIRGRVDAILVGSGTALADDPLLTARLDQPPARRACRIVVDSSLRLSLESQLARTAREYPTLLATTDRAPANAIAALTDRGCEVLTLPANEEGHVSLPDLLRELGRRRFTNLLVEGGGQILGNLFDLRAVDEVHVFIAGKILGGAGAPSPVAGLGRDKMAGVDVLGDLKMERIGTDCYLSGRVSR